MCFMSSRYLLETVLQYLKLICCNYNNNIIIITLSLLHACIIILIIYNIALILWSLAIINMMHALIAHAIDRPLNSNY